MGTGRECPAAANLSHPLTSVHLLEYLWDAAWSFHEAGDPRAEDWLGDKALAVLADGAEAVLTLRAVISNGDYPEEYWHFHLEREHQRLYPGIKQEQYTLGA